MRQIQHPESQQEPAEKSVSEKSEAVQGGAQEPRVPLLK
jgi:hypothetical protein